MFNKSIYPLKLIPEKNDLYFSKIENFLFIIGTILVFLSFIRYWPNYFWDLNVYQNAINIFNSGGSAYLDFDGLRFVYAPYVLILFSLLGKTLSFSLVVLYLSSCLFILRQKLGSQLILYTVISSSVFFNDFIARSFATGNLTIFLHFSIITSACIRCKKHKEIFLLIILIATLIKPYLFAYVFLGFTIWPNERKYIKGLSITILLITLLFVSQLFFTPDLFRDFTESLFLQAIGDRGGPGRDVGLAPYWLFGSVLNRYFALGLHFIFVFLLGKSFFHLAKLLDKFLNIEDARKLIFFISLICVTFINPRMKVYDYWIVLGSSAGIICTLFSQPNFLSMKVKFYSLILTGLVFSFLPVVLKIYLPPFLSYSLCLFFYKKDRSSNDSLSSNFYRRTYDRGT